jgi:hypothetical protein
MHTLHIKTGTKCGFHYDVDVRGLLGAAAVIDFHVSAKKLNGKAALWIRWFRTCAESWRGTVRASRIQLRSWHHECGGSTARKGTVSEGAGKQNKGNA